MSVYSISSTPEPLHIVCPRARQPMAIVLSCAALSVLALAAFKLLNDPERFSWFKVWVLVLMATACVALIVRNLFVRDELLLYRDGAPEWALGEEDMLVLAAASVRSVRVGPEPGPYSADGKYAALGMGQGLIEIETTGGCYRFGAGLDVDACLVTARQIATYCGLHEAGPQWKAA
ncbi:hypothetical protein [Massilia sp. 9I]|uniref:hypothetical protein n=1 Tax=Massilia sp. 9I TaxID=2653152 RepID=UPI0012F2BD76|nr:hypothetical protein [Massilia sp. 9I]VXB03842.1 conserved hypothetical protein [Massilia sp. 9I]